MSWQPPEPKPGQPFTAADVEAAADLDHPPSPDLAKVVGELLRPGLARTRRAS